MTTHSLPDPIPIDGGWHVKSLGDGTCVDVLKMMYNYRVVRSDEAHVTYENGYCYFGHGEDAEGNPRTMHSAYLTAMSAAAVWDGSGDPPGFDKRAC